MLKSSSIVSQSIYLWSMFCVNISVGNRFDFASITDEPSGDRFDNQFVDRQRSRNIIGFGVSHRQNCY